MLWSLPSTHGGRHLAFSIDHCLALSTRQGLWFVGSSQGPWHLTQWLAESRYSGASVIMTPDKASVLFRVSAAGDLRSNVQTCTW